MPRYGPVACAVVVAALLSGCGPDPPGPDSAAPSSAGTPAVSVPARVPLPDGFPVPPGALPIAMPSDDPGLIGLWTSDLRGSAAYDFYVAALRAAGYPILALYPGGAAAVIRFRLPDGAVWQVVTRTGAEGSVAIEVRLDRA